MSQLVLSTKSRKLLLLCEAEGFTTIDQLLAAKGVDSVFPNICMTEDCDHVEDLEGDQQEGYCSYCGGTTMVSGLILAGVI